MSNGGFTAVSPFSCSMRRAQTTKNPSLVIPEMGSLETRPVSVQVCNSVRGPLLMGGATTKPCACRSESWGGEYRQAAKLPSRLARVYDRHPLIKEQPWRAD